MLNRLLGGHYRVVQALGEGGLAKTYIAEDHHRPGHPQCAVKYLKPASKDPRFLPIARRLFNQEAEILEKLGQHDQIPRLLAYFEENKEFYLVQEFIEGHTLSAELPMGQPWSENKVIQMLQDVLQILKFVHSYGVIHRDIKPNNLIRRQKDNRLVLIDFGAVKQVSDPNITIDGLLSQNTISIGTPGYIPTEQVRGKPRLNSDIYALGMIAIQALTGVNPLHLQEDADGEIIWQDRAEVTNELAAIITKMVRYHFKERYQSATEVLYALQPQENSYTLIQSTSETKQATPEVAVEANLGQTKVALNIKQSISDLASEKKEKTSIFSPADSLAPSADLKLSQGNIFVYLNKYRLLIGAGILSVVLSIIGGYTYMTQRQHYLQAQEVFQQIERLKGADKYQECVEQAERFLKDYSSLHTEVQTLLYECLQGQDEEHLAQARRRAEERKFKNGIAENDQQVELKSDKGIDYTQLRNYLEAGNWKEADHETYRVMLQAAKIDKEGIFLTKESIKNFPCNDLKTINSLWQNYSYGLFGFSIQNNLYQNFGKSPSALANEIRWRIGNRWRASSDLWKNFNEKNVPEGHLPARIFRTNDNEKWSLQIHIGGILDRTNSCNL